MTRLIVSFLTVALMFAAFYAVTARAQNSHSHGHHEYRDWSSLKVASCCSNEDCRGLAEAEVQQTADGPAINIDGQWCPVLREHYLTRGRSPDWSVPHACIRTKGQGCDRLLCYTPAGGF